MISNYRLNHTTTSYIMLATQISYNYVHTNFGYFLTIFMKRKKNVEISV